MPTDDLALTTDGLAELHAALADALDLAIAAGAPFPLLQKLAAANGFTRALREVPKHDLMPTIVTNAKAALAEWQRFRAARPPKAVA
jgi:hypothetical protein